MREVDGQTWVQRVFILLGRCHLKKLSRSTVEVSPSPKRWPGTAAHCNQYNASVNMDITNDMAIISFQSARPSSKRADSKAGQEMKRASDHSRCKYCIVGCEFGTAIRRLRNQDKYVGLLPFSMSVMA